MKRAIARSILLLLLTPAVYAQPVPFVDNLRNTSILSDEEIEWYLVNSTREELAARLDLNNDGIADGTRLDVHEFIGRMEVIIICRKERMEQLMRKALERSAPGLFEPMDV